MIPRTSTNRFTHIGVGVIPVKLIRDDILAGVGRFRPRECNRRLANGRGLQVPWLTGHALLRLHLERLAERTRTDTGESLNANGVDGVRLQVTDGRQLVVVHHLRLPGGQREVRLKRVVHFVALRTKYQA